MKIQPEKRRPAKMREPSIPSNARAQMAARSLWRDAFAMATLAIIYFISAKLGLRLALVHESATAVWPPTGISLAALLLFGKRVWPGVLIGAFLANLSTRGIIP